MLIQTSRQTSITYSNLCSENISDQGKLLLMRIRLFSSAVKVDMYECTFIPFLIYPLEMERSNTSMFNRTMVERRVKITTKRDTESKIHL